MSIVNIIKRASNRILGVDKSIEKIDIYEDNEVLFCKNNVCIHPPISIRQESELIHYPGYLTVTSKTFVDQFNKASRSTLLLTWIPNSSLCKSKSEEKKFYKKCEVVDMNGTQAIDDIVIPNGFRNETIIKNEEKSEIDGFNVDIQELRNELQPLLGEQLNSIRDIKVLLNRSHITSVNITISNPYIENINVKDSINSVVTDINKLYLNSEYYVSDDIDFYNAPSSILSVKDKPKSYVEYSVARKKTNCRRFSVDLSQMRSLRLFFNNDNCTSGQLVISSRESQYKILHFHHGGLDHLAQVLHQWHGFLHNIAFPPGLKQQNLPYRQFMVCRPEIKKRELHPDEGSVRKITTNFFYGTLINIKGQIEDDLLLRKCVFFGGLEKGLRRTIWPFLLKCYSFSSTFDDRAVFMDIRKQEYEEITRKRLYSMSPEEQIHFWKSVQCVVEKDIARIDRSNAFFYGDDNPNREIMKNILLNYAFHNAGNSYSQVNSTRRLFLLWFSNQ
uniref:TBC1 domain family member 16 n=1 Tax=Bactrocera latifrons TaxID=174628 RepID=A0A0K8TYQ8_BACLA